MTKRGETLDEAVRMDTASDEKCGGKCSGQLLLAPWATERVAGGKEMSNNTYKIYFLSVSEVTCP